METKVARPLATAVISSLLGCTTPQTTEVASAAAPPLPKYLEPLPRLAMPGFCQLGSSCMTMDERPFEPCLLSTKHCSDKAAEPMLVAPPPRIFAAPRVESL